MLREFITPMIEWTAIVPMIIIALSGMIALLLDMYRKDGNNRTISAASILGVAIALVYTLGSAGKSMMTFGSMFYSDSLSSVGQFSVLSATLITLLFSERYLTEKKISFGEFYPLILWATLGAMILCNTRHLLVIFIGIEILSISLYVLAGMNRGDVKSEESALKYFLLGSFATGFLLYGIAFFYGATGTLDFSSFGGFWGQAKPENRLLLTISMALITVGLGFKASLVPFHQWTPDVYSGAPTNVVGFMATAGKVGIFVVLIEVGFVLAQVQDQIRLIYMTLSILTMTVGNIMAFVQKDLKRLLAYSSIANAGYVLVAVTAAMTKTGPGTSSLSYFIIGYVFSTLGLFAVISLTAKDGNENPAISSLNGLSKRSPFAAGALVVFVLSQIGIGPVSGFVGKFLLVGDALKVDLPILAVALVLNSVFGAYYYFGLVRAAFSDSEESAPIKFGPAVASAIGICLIMVVGSVVFYTPMMSYFAAK